MNKLISLEIRKNCLRPYHIAALVCSAVILVFLYFMAAIPLIDPSETDNELFSSYGFLITLNHLLCMACFTILGAVMGARFVVEDYSGKRAVLLFCCPVSRKRILGAKLWLVFLYPAGAMLLCGIVTEGLFFLTESLFPLCAGRLTPATVLWSLFSLLCYCLLAGAWGIISLWIGFLKKSVPVTIVASVIAISLLCQILSASFSFRPALLIFTGVTALVAGTAVTGIFRQVENMEV